MSSFQRGAAMAVLAAAAVLSTASAASAQSYGRLVVFGDSLSDNGNLFAVTGGAAPAAPFVNGRFSTGPVFVELLGFNLGRQTAGSPVTGSINYAYGGSRTDAIATPGPGMRTQLQAYTAAGGRFGANDLVSILGGANNIFQALPTAGVSANPTGSISPVSIAAAADINFLTNSVAAAGAASACGAAVAADACISASCLSASRFFAGVKRFAFAFHAESQTETPAGSMPLLATAAVAASMLSNVV